MNTSDYPRFTVIIPQKNRAEYMEYTLRTCMIQDYPNFEVIVSDDCSDDNSVEVIERLCKQDSRIKLFAHKQHLGMRDNFEFALSQVKPGYVMALGGDDGLVPGCITRMYQILTETKRKLLTWPHASYSYPHNNSNGHSVFRVMRYKNTGVKFIKSSDFLRKIADTFLYMVDECPMFYIKGVVSTELVDRVKTRTKDGSFYYCPTPDGFSGVVLAGEVEDYVFTPEPLSIGGTTTKSQGQNYTRTDQESRKESEQFFNDNIRRTMHRELASQPYSPLITLMTADYLLTAQELPGWPAKDAFKVSFDLLLKRTFKFLENHYFANEVLVRELNILKQIAVQHNLELLFNELLAKTKKKVKVHEEQYGFMITNSIRFDGETLGMKNLFDASLAVNFVYNCYNRFHLSGIFSLLKRQVGVLVRYYCTKSEKLPPI